MDEIIVFRQLGEDQKRSILDLELKAIRTRIAEAKACPMFELLWTDKAANYLLARGTDERYGSRELKRTIERLVVQPMTGLILSRQIQASDVVTIDADDSGIIWRNEPYAKPLPTK